MKPRSSRTTKYNPFRPNSMVSPGMFCGRWEESRATEKSLFQTKHGNPKHFLVQGERGIGKSSLLLCVDFVANGEIDPLDNPWLSFIVVAVELARWSTFEDIVSCIAPEFKSQVARRVRLQEVRVKGWEFVGKWN